MDIAKELAQYLDDANFGTLGTDIFAGQLPADQNGIYVMLNGGTLNFYNPISESIVDIYVKDTMAYRCVQTLNNIKKHIHRMHTTVKNNAYIYSMLVIGDVEDVARDLEYAKIFKITVSIINRDTSVIS